MRRLIHNSDGVYMVDEECLKKKEMREKQKEMRWQETKERNKSSRKRN